MSEQEFNNYSLQMLDIVSANVKKYRQLKNYTQMKLDFCIISLMCWASSKHWSGRLVRFLKSLFGVRFYLNVVKLSLLFINR
jgi:hypothetical protein